MKYQLPLQVPEAEAVKVTQAFGPTQNPLEPVGPNGEPHFHYGVDIVCGDDHATFGAALRCPFPTAHIINEFEQPQGSPTTPFLQLQYKAEDGTVYDTVFAHCSHMEPVGEYTQGQLIARVGNIGLTSPQPTLKDPYAGAHLHLGLRVNGTWVDPFPYFDIAAPFIGAGPTPQDQLPATNWLIKQIEAFITGLTGRIF